MVSDGAGGQSGCHVAAGPSPQIPGSVIEVEQDVRLWSCSFRKSKIV